ncbi:MAG: hypothetical protein ACFBWO_00515 [Paracoccaceae bacterium]
MKFYVNTDARRDGTHMMHSERCQFLPGEDKRKSLGDYAKSETALGHAEAAFDKVGHCRTCCPDLN